MAFPAMLCFSCSRLTLFRLCRAKCSRYSVIGSAPSLRLPCSRAAPGAGFVVFFLVRLWGYSAAVLHLHLHRAAPATPAPAAPAPVLPCSPAPVLPCCSVSGVERAGGSLVACCSAAPAVVLVLLCCPGGVLLWWRGKQSLAQEQQVIHGGRGGRSLGMRFRKNPSADFTSKTVFSATTTALLPDTPSSLHPFIPSSLHPFIPAPLHPCFPTALHPLLRLISG